MGGEVMICFQALNRSKGSLGTALSAQNELRDGVTTGNTGDIMRVWTCCQAAEGCATRLWCRYSGVASNAYGMITSTKLWFSEAGACADGEIRIQPLHQWQDGWSGARGASQQRKLKRKWG